MSKCGFCNGSGVSRFQWGGAAMAQPCSACLGGRKRLAEGPPSVIGAKPGKKWLAACVKRFTQGWTIPNLAEWSGHSAQDIEDAVRAELVASLRRQSSRERAQESIDSMKRRRA